MKRIIIPSTLVAVAVAGALPLAALAAGTPQTNMPAQGQTQAQMAMAAKLTLNDASALALKAHPGTLVAVGFNDENGQGVYEATVIGTDGQPWLIKMDANSGQVLASGASSLIGDEQSAGEGNGQDEMAEGSEAGQAGQAAEVGETGENG